MEAAAARMGLDTDKDVYLDEEDFDGEGNALSGTAQKEKENFEREVEMDEDLAFDLAMVEAELAEQSFAVNDDDDESLKQETAI